MNTDHYHEQYTQLRSLRGAAQPAWLERARAAAFERFAELGFPTQRDEDWKYTSVAGIDKRSFRLAPASSDGVSADQVATLALGDSHLLVFVNGRHAPALSRPGRLPSGAEMIGTAFYHAIGYNTVDVYLADIDRETLGISESATIRDPFGSWSETRFSPSPRASWPSLCTNSRALRRNSPLCR